MKVRKLLLWVLTVVLLFTMTACGSASNATDSYYRYEEAPEAAEMETIALASDSASPENTSALPDNRKLIRTIRMEAETENLDPMLAALDEKIGQLGGYVESQEVYNGSSYSQRRYRNASLTIRIPAEAADSFVEHIGGISNIVSSNETVEDITLQYVDTESRVAALEVEQERLMALLEQADSLSDLLEIESRLTQVRYELENYASQLRGYDNKVNYATIRLNISEVQEYTPVAEETVWQRISGGFVDSLKGIGEGAVEVLIWVLANSPYLLLYGGILTVLVTIVRRARKKKGKKQEPPKTAE